MMKKREFEINKNLFAILDENLRMVYFSRFTKSIVEKIIKDLGIQNYIKKNEINYKELENYNFTINKYMINNSHIFIIEIEVVAILKFINNMHIDNLTGLSIKKFKNNKDEGTNIKNEIEDLRDKLNLLMRNNYKNNYDKVLEISIKLDNAINEYCMLENDK